MAFDFIYKGFTKAVFSEDAGLNIIPSDLGEEMIGVNFDGDAVKRIRTAIGTIASPELFVETTLTIHVLKTSPQYIAYKNRVAENTIINGEVTLYDDANVEWQFSKLSLKVTGITTSGNDATVQFALQCNWIVNTKLIASFE